MANIRILTWNIEVYGPNKYGRSVNNAQLVDFVGSVVAHTNANILVIQEMLSSVGDQVAFSICEGIQQASGQNWSYYVTWARVNGDRESYGFFWRTDAAANFGVAVDNAGQNVAGLATLEFPNNFSMSNGRRAAFMTFRTTDTAQNFTVTSYHAPPNGNAIRGLQQIASMPQLYAIANPGVGGGAVPARLLCGDYNLDVTVQPEYSWFTNPVPMVPPPAAPGQGAGTVAATVNDTHLTAWKALTDTYGAIANWPAATADYIEAQAIDNIFYAGGAAPAGSVVDVLGQIATPGTGIRVAAQALNRSTPAGGEAFPHSLSIPLPFAATLSTAAYAFLLYRYAVSDHLPVLLNYTI